MGNKKELIVGLVSARGGSIRVPRKNLKEFCGHPLCAWPIMALRCSRLVDRKSVV
jgi:N-acylneuraminate cytidylyltransferase